MEAGYVSFILAGSLGRPVSVLAWIFIGLAVLGAILALGLRLNRKKRTARMAVRLAEVYRSRGRFETARRLYQVPFDLDQNREEAQRGLDRVEEKDTTPVMEPALVEDAERMLVEAREHLEKVLNKRGVDVRLPPLGDEDA